MEHFKAKLGDFRENGKKQNFGNIVVWIQCTKLYKSKARKFYENKKQNKNKNNEQPVKL